jgi:hypothetical protein
MAMVFELGATITGAGQCFAGNYLNSRLGIHEKAQRAARVRRMYCSPGQLAACCGYGVDPIRIAVESAGIYNLRLYYRGYAPVAALHIYCGKWRRDCLFR